MKNFLIAPSILSANFASLGKDIEESLLAGGDLIHFDVMDNHFVKNLTIGPLVLKSLREYGIKSLIDIHLMTNPIKNLIIEFSKYYPNAIIFHPESSNNIIESIDLIKTYNCKVGIALNINTSLQFLKNNILNKIDLLLLMGVNPGFPGQKIIPQVFNKIIEVKKIIDTENNNIILGIDGGVKIKNIFKIASLGINLFVIGSAIFNSNNYKFTINKIRKKLLQIK